MAGRAVLFDLDNTLHDRDRGVREFLADQHARHDLNRRSIPLSDWTQAFVELEQNGRVWKDVVYRALSERFSLPVEPEILLREYEIGYASFVQPVDGALPTVAECRNRGWKTGLITNGRTHFQRRTIAAIGLEPLVDVILISEECGLRKPDPAIYLMALQALDCAPENSWFIGDDPAADVQGAEAVGMRALLFKQGVSAGPGCIGTLANLCQRLGQED
jgi:putative hydrolase of the HAD superfamily